jgi:hypothetical protein
VLHLKMHYCGFLCHDCVLKRKPQALFFDAYKNKAAEENRSEQQSRESGSRKI